MSAAQALPISEPDTKGLQLVEKTNENVTRANGIKVNSPETRGLAVEFLKGIKALRAEAEEHHRPIIDAAHKTHKAACDALNRIDKPLKDAEGIVKGQVGAFDLAEEKKRADAQRQAEEAARKEQERLAVATAEAAEAAGASVEEAHAIFQEEMTAPPVIPAMPPAAVQDKQGVGTRYNYKVQVRDLPALLKFVLENPTFQKFVEANETALNSFARMQKEAFDIPGCKLIREPVVAVR